MQCHARLRKRGEVPVSGLMVVAALLPTLLQGTAMIAANAWSDYCQLMHARDVVVRGELFRNRICHDFASANKTAHGPCGMQGPYSRPAG